MKKNYFFKSFLFLIPVVAFTLLSNSSGVGGARTGSPGDGGASCISCHSAGANFGNTAIITTNIPANGYDVDTDYSITVTATSSAPGHGFQLTAERLSDNNKIGNFTAGSGSIIQDGGTRISHSNRNNNSWSFTWRSPSTLQGPVRFYAAVNAVNNNNANSGDEVITIESTPINALSTNESRLLKFEMFPNPATNFLYIQLPTGTSEAQVGVFDYTGRQVNSSKVTLTNNQLDVSGLAAGMYIIRISADGKIGAQRFIKS